MIGAGWVGRSGAAAPRAAAEADLAGVKALVFDTFGTVVDYRSSVIAEGEALGKTRLGV